MFNVRSALSADETNYYVDPMSGPLDQQGWWVQQYTIDVLPAAQIRGFIVPTDVERGAQAETTVRVKNNDSVARSYWVGLSFAHETATLADWPANWYDIKPQQTSVLQSGAEEDVTFTFTVFRNLKPGQYYAEAATWTNFNSDKYLMEGEIDRATNYDQWREGPNDTGETSFVLGGFDASYSALEEFSYFSSIAFNGNITVNLQKPQGALKPLLYVAGSVGGNTTILVPTPSGVPISVPVTGNAKASFLIDLVDLLTISPEGEDGWVTCWIDVGGYAGLGWTSLENPSPVSIDVGIIPNGIDWSERALVDDRRGWELSPQLRLPGFAVTLTNFNVLDPEFEFNGSADLSLGISGEAQGLISFEFRRSLLISAMSNSYDSAEAFADLVGLSLSNNQGLFRATTWDDGDWLLNSGQWEADLKLTEAWNDDDRYAHYFSFDVPAGTSGLQLNTSGGTGNADLYLRFGQRPTISSYDFRSENAGNTESILVSSPQAGRWYIMVPTTSSYDGVNLVASLTAPEIDVERGGTNDVHSHNFGNVPIGQSASQTFTVRNEGDAALTVERASGLGAPFTINPVNGSGSGDDWAIVPSGTRTFTVTFSPTSVTSYSDTLTLVSNDKDEGSYQISFSGTGTAPEINVELPGQPDNVHSYNFGEVRTAQSASQTFTVRNEGDATLTVTQASGLDTPFTITPVNGSGSGDDWSIAPGGTTTFTVTFSPTAATGYSDTLTLASNDADEGSYQISLNGTGTTPDIDVELPGQLNNVHSYDFSGEGVGTSASQQFTVRNEGTGNLRVDRASGLDGTAFSISPTNGSGSGDDWIIPSSGTRTFTISFAPTALTTYSEVLTLSSDDPDENGYQITLTGEGVSTGVRITESDDSTNVAEGGATDDYEVVLVSAPTANVTITIAGDSQVNVAPTTLTFTTTDWNQSQTVTVTAVNDDVDEDSPHTGAITHTTSSADVRYNGIDIDTVTANVTDNDTAGITVNPTSGLRTTEAGGTATFAVVLNSEPTANVTIGLSSSDPTEGTVSTTSLTFQPGNWDTPKTVTVTGVNDDLDDGDIAYTIVTAAASSGDTKYSGINPPDVSVTNIAHHDIDFADAPSPYPTTLAEDGSRHIATGPTLGANRDDESDGTHSPNADADDTTGLPDDEDGVTFGRIAVGQFGATVTVNVQNAPSGASLDAWVDFNGDGSWGGPSEHIAASMVVSNGDNIIRFDVPSWAHPGAAFSRFRVSTPGNPGLRGLASDGEVEDHRVTILPPTETDGTFGDQQVVFAQPANGGAVHAADIDSDGDLDVVASRGSNETAWYRNNGEEGFSKHIVATHHSDTLYATDMDGDGDVDILSTPLPIEGQPVGVFWHENDGGQNFTEHTVAEIRARYIFPADIDDDGDQDVIGYSFTDKMIVLLENDGTQRFAQRVIGTPSDLLYSLYPVDIDLDGDLDVVAQLGADGTQDMLAWFENEGNDTVWLEHVISQSRSGGGAVFATDLDSDGDVDVVTGDAQTLVWFENNGSAEFSEHLIDRRQVESLFVTDLDGDGDMDIVAAYWNSSRIVWHENDGEQRFTSKLISSVVRFPGLVLVGDLNGDGALDVMSASAVDPDVVWYESLPGKTIDFGPSFGAPATEVVLTDQLLAYGVLFSTTDPEGVTWFGGPGSPSSYTYVIHAGQLLRIGGPCAGIDPIRVDFSPFVTEASVRGFDGGGDTDTLILQAFDGRGNLVDSETITSTFSPGHTAAVNAVEIAYVTFEVSGTCSGLFFDDLRFVPVPNYAPTAISIDNNSVVENTMGAVIGRLAVSDPNSNDIHTLTVDDDRFEIANSKLKLKNDTHFRRDTDNSITLNITAQDNGSPPMSLTRPFTITVVDNPTPWKNSKNSFDTNHDDIIAPIDVLIIINELNSPTSIDESGRLIEVQSPGSFYFDVNGDGYCTPIDALLIINHLNSSAVAEGEHARSSSTLDGPYRMFSLQSPTARSGLSRNTTREPPADGVASETNKATRWLPYPSPAWQLSQAPAVRQRERDGTQRKEAFIDLLLGDECGVKELLEVFGDDLNKLR